MWPWSRGQEGGEGSNSRPNGKAPLLGAFDSFVESFTEEVPGDEDISDVGDILSSDGEGDAARRDEVLELGSSRGDIYAQGRQGMRGHVQEHLSGKGPGGGGGEGRGAGGGGGDGTGLVQLEGRTRKRKKGSMKTFGALCSIACAVTCWVLEIMLTQIIMAPPGESNHDVHLTYDQPYVLMWAAHSLHAPFGFGLGWLLISLTKRQEKRDESRKFYQALVYTPTNGYLARSAFLSTLGTATGILWFMSIPLTSALVNTVLYQTSCVWCFVLSAIILGERVTLTKAASTAVTLLGVAGISRWPCVDEDSVINPPDPSGTTDTTPAPVAPPDEALGVALVLSSALLYSFYEVLLKSFTDDDIAPGSPPGSSLEAPLAPEDFSVNPRVPENSSKGSACEPKVPQGGLNSALYACALTGWMGVFNFLFLWIPILILDLNGDSIFTLPSYQALPLVLVDASLEGLFGCFLVLAISLSSPLFVTVCTVVAIPMSAMLDALVHGLACQWMSLGSCFFVLCGFGGINLASAAESWDDWPDWL